MDIDYALETLRPVTATDGDAFASSTYDPANEMTTPSTWLTFSPVGMPRATQGGVFLGDAQALLASPPFNISPTFAAKSSLWMKPTTEDALEPTGT